MDGTPQLLAGTYGQELLNYKLALDGGEFQAEPGQMHRKGLYNLCSQRTFAYPVCALHSNDIDLDGVDELTVTSLHGVHVLKAAVEPIADRIVRAVGSWRKQRNSGAAACW